MIRFCSPTLDAQDIAVGTRRRVEGSRMYEALQRCWRRENGGAREKRGRSTWSVVDRALRLF